MHNLKGTIGPMNNMNDAESQTRASCGISFLLRAVRRSADHAPYNLGWTEPNGPIETIRGVGYRYRSPSE